MFVLLFTGGARCCTTHYVFALEPALKLLATLNDADGDMTYFERTKDGHSYYKTRARGCSVFHRGLREERRAGRQARDRQNYEPRPPWLLRIPRHNLSMIVTTIAPWAILFLIPDP
jgi:hypothetical protein